ncbi:MAG: DUF3943 domain-containing protein [Prolixibacteraceae bacterium]|jgi:hypothetical protein|nr:DUF3943 domain-containing protein [Prolixibacteraceae bacterium]
MTLRLFIGLLLFVTVSAQGIVLPRNLNRCPFQKVFVDKSKNYKVLNDWYPAGDQLDTVSWLRSLRNENARFGTKVWRGSLFVFGFEMCSSTFLYLSPETISNWDRSELTLKNCLNNFKRAYTEPPVFDNDLWIVNYVGHPYQGAYFYNAVRSQNATILQSSLFCFGHSMLWEYFTEAFFEQPSIQDMVVTPITGIVFGELAHRATIRMGRNGFAWYEKGLIILINPMYVINNGFKSGLSKKRIVEW